jgi:uncharacterized membrane protein (GlpM family)
MMWIARFIAAGSVVTAAGLIAARVGAGLGGLVLAFPFVIGTGLVFASMQSAEHFRAVTTGVLWGILPLAVFAATVALAAQRSSALAALALGVIAWLCVAMFIQRFLP